MRVTVIILCYNLENYIRRAIESVLSQKTDFKFEVIVLNDGSTDNSLEIIKEYKDKVSIISWKNNKGLIKSRMYSFNLAIGDYIALCDGDDYWIDEYKLRKQVDYLDINPRCGMVHTCFEVNNEINNENIKIIRARIPEGKLFESMLFNNKISSCTSMFRRKYWDEIDKIAFSKLNGSEDRFIWMDIAAKSDIGYIKDITGVYTKRRGSISGYKDNKKQSRFVEESYDIRYYYIDKYGCSNAIQKLLYQKALDIAKSINNGSMEQKAEERLSNL